MDETQRLTAVAALDEAIEQVERAQTPADMRAVADDVLDVMEAAMGGGIIHMVLERFRERMLTRVEDTDPEKARAEMLPQLRQWRDHIASGADIPVPPPVPAPTPVRDPENRPTRPGCTGGAALLITFTLALVWALAACR